MKGCRVNKREKRGHSTGRMGREKKTRIIPAQNIRLAHAMKFDTFHVALAAIVDDDMPTKAGEASILARGGDIAKRNDVFSTSRIGVGKLGIYR